jgi:hypothetical protein
LRIAAAAIAAIIAAFALERFDAARADQPSPFPSPSPVASQAPGAGGFFSIGFSSQSANGGMIPGTAVSPSPRPFRPGTATGFDLDLVSRLSTGYVAGLDFGDASIHGDDSAIVSRLDLSVMRRLGVNGDFAVGLAYGALQRSNVSTSENGIGLSAKLLPDFSHRVSPYATLFYYPTLPAPLNTRGSLTVFGVGAAFSLPTGNWFARLGFTSQTTGASTTSPQSLSGVELGVGTRF